ncbi:unnamed protein product [marine sediment metagenome]|uniref:Inositol oxygenase n=1 Tax=marine sediment metagenome TaxID=412755 RepID=X1TB33_9ZZZZ
MGPNSFLHKATEGWEHLDDFEKVSVNSEKAEDEFRNYKDSERQIVVENHYRLMRTNQTFAFVDKMYKKYHSFDKKKMTIWDAFEVLGTYVDSSDPDTELPNIEHGFQTAEVNILTHHFTPYSFSYSYCYSFCYC